MGTRQSGLFRMAVDSLDQQIYHHQRVRLAFRLGTEHGYRSADSDHHSENRRISGHLEDLHVIGQNARTETENR